MTDYYLGAKKAGSGSNDLTNILSSIGKNTLKAAAGGALQAGQAEAIARIQNDPRVKQVAEEKAKEIAKKEAADKLDKLLAWVKTPKAKLIIGGVAVALVALPILAFVLGRLGKKKG